MKTTDFAIYLNKYFIDYLPNESCHTPMTIDSYRYTFILYLTCMQEKLQITADRILISDLTRKNVLLFLEWLKIKRQNSISTRNQRQAAINSFVKFLVYEFPEHLDEYQRILGIPIKKAPQKEISYMKTDGVELLMSQVNIESSNGLRDYVMLSLFYTTGLRVSELINIRVKDLSLYVPYTLLLHGKAKKSNPEIIPNDLSPHKMRHTVAMGLVDSGVDLIYIRDLLGHVSVKTTEVYAKTDVRRKREAIEAVSKEIVPPEASEWDNNTDLKQWLKMFNRK